MDSFTAIKILAREASEERTLCLLENVEYDLDVCEAAAPILKLDEKSKKELLTLMKKTRHDFDICRLCTPFLKLSEKKNKELLSMLEDGGYAPALCAICIPYLESSEWIRFIMYKSNYDDRTCLIGLQEIEKRQK